MFFNSEKERLKEEIERLKEEIKQKDLIIEQQNKEIGIKKTAKQQRIAEIKRRYYINAKKRGKIKTKRSYKPENLIIEEDKEKPKEDLIKDDGFNELRKLRSETLLSQSLKRLG